MTNDVKFLLNSAASHHEKIEAHRQSLVELEEHLIGEVQDLTDHVLTDAQVDEIADCIGLPMPASERADRLEYIIDTILSD